MSRDLAWVVLCGCFVGCDASATPSPGADAGIDAAVTDPTGRWSCALLPWSEARMGYDADAGATQVSVTVARTAAGITWQTEFVQGQAQTLTLAARGAGWSLASPVMFTSSSPDSGGRVDTLDVSWRGERLWAEMAGVSTVVGGSLTLRDAFDCARAP